MTGRLSCAVNGCLRTTGKPFAVWICGKHWMRLTKAERRVWARIRRQAKRYGWDALDRERHDRIWYGLVRRASL